MILTRKYWAPSVATKENYLKINDQRYLNKTDMLILAEKKKTEKMLLKKTVKYHLMIHLFRCL